MNWSRATVIWMSLSDLIVALSVRLPRWRSKLLPLRDLMSIQGRCGDPLVALGRLGAPTRQERGISAWLGVTRESTSGLLPSLLQWANGQCPHAARRKLTDHAVLVSF